MYGIQFSSVSEKFLNKLQKAEAERILQKLYSIRHEPFCYAVRLKGTRLYRLRIGDYRAELDILIKESTIFVVRIGHRRNIYRQGFRK